MTFRAFAVETKMTPLWCDVWIHFILLGTVKQIKWTLAYSIKTACGYQISLSSLRHLLSSVSQVHIQLGPVKFLSYTLETVSFSLLYTAAKGRGSTKFDYCAQHQLSGCLPDEQSARAECLHVWSCTRSFMYSGRKPQQRAQRSAASRDLFSVAGDPRTAKQPSSPKCGSSTTNITGFT